MANAITKLTEVSEVVSVHGFMEENDVKVLVVGLSLILRSKKLKNFCFEF